MPQHWDWHLNLVQYEGGEGGDFASREGIVSTEHEDELQREALEWKGK